MKLKKGVLLFMAAQVLIPSALVTGEVMPIRLRCEYAANPLGIDAVRPRLSWALVSEQRAEVQTAYRVLAASEEAKLAAGLADLWDSGKVASDQSVHVVYGGKPLRSRMRVHWKVRAWDKKGKASPWSENATWRMGLLDPADWKAKWVGAGSPSSVAMLRKTFPLSSRVQRATIYVSALGLYELRLNGKRVGENVLAPEWTDYRKRVQYQTYDVTDMLQSGENAIGAIVGEGWYAGRIGIAQIVVPAGPSRGLYGPRPRFLFQMEVKLAEGGRRIIVSDRTWKATTDGPIRSSCLLDGEVYDGRLEMPRWDLPRFDDSGWKPVDVEPQVSAKLVAQPNEPIRIVEELKPLGITEPTPRVFVFDFGQNMVGWCRLKVRGPAGTAVTLRHGEVLDDDGNVYTDNLRVPEDGGPAGARQTDKYILRGQGEEVFEPHFTYHGFRYVEVQGLSQKPSLDSLTGCVIHSAVSPAGRFECSSPMLNKLMENIRWTQRGNMHSIPTDCPQRDERMGWLGDAQIFSQTACFNMDMARFFTKWLRDIRDAQADDGRYPDFAPHPFNPNARFSGAPGWADGGAIIPWRVYVNYGDKRILEEHFDSAKRWVEYVRSQSPELIWTGHRGNDYGDWLNGNTLLLDGWPDSGAAVPNEVFATAFFAHSTELLSRMAAVIGRSDDAARYASLAKSIKAAFNRAFVKPDGCIRGDTQAGYALALCFDLIPDERRDLAAKRMVERIKERNWRLSTGIQSTTRLMLELTRNGRNDVAYRLVNERAAPSWGYMVEHGATTVWERWDGYVEGRGFQDPSMNSFNHYAFGGVGEWMFRTIVGINPDEENPGFKHFRIRPRPGGGLEWARGTYESIHGAVVSDWKIKADSFTLNVTVPVNTTATVYVPTSGRAVVTESGKRAEKSEAVEFLRTENAAVVYRVGSGKYRFVARQ